MLADLRLDDYIPTPTALYTPKRYGILMITRTQAQAALRAFTWCDLLEFMECYEIAYGHEAHLGSYIDEQFDLMQRKPLDFIVKWDAMAAQIITRYAARNK